MLPPVAAAARSAVRGVRILGPVGGQPWRWRSGMGASCAHAGEVSGLLQDRWRQSRTSREFTSPPSGEPLIGRPRLSEWAYLVV